jgi:hypothetical protein
MEKYLSSVYEWTGQPAKERKACAQALLLNPNFEAAHRLQTEIENELKAANAPKPPAPKLSGAFHFLGWRFLVPNRNRNRNHNPNYARRRLRLGSGLRLGK